MHQSMGFYTQVGLCFDCSLSIPVTLLMPVRLLVKIIAACVEIQEMCSLCFVLDTSKGLRV